MVLCQTGGYDLPFEGAIVLSWGLLERKVERDPRGGFGDRAQIKIATARGGAEGIGATGEEVGDAIGVLGEGKEKKVKI